MHLQSRGRWLLTCMVFSLVLAVVAAHAEIYSYVDDRGATTFVDDIGKVPKKYRKKLKTKDDLQINGMEMPAGQPARRAKPPEQVAAPEPVTGPVELFVTSWCGYCKKMERSLADKGVAFVKYDIEQDADAHRRFKEFGGSGVPLTSVGGKIVRGYNPDQVLQLLRR